MIEEIYLEARLGAIRGASRLTPEVLAIVGMSDPRMRHLLNNVGRHVRTYLEVGCYHGSTLVAAAFRNPHLLAVGVDNFSQDHPELNAGGVPREQLAANLARFAPHVRVIEADFRDLDRDRLPVLDCYFYDGAHDRPTQREAVTFFAPRFGPECLLLVDDWNWEDVRLGTYDGLSAVANRLRVVCSAALCDTWNNVGVFVLERRR